MTRIAAVVVTFNRSELLLGCLRALNEQTRRLDAIYVVDNASTDSTEDTVSRFSREAAIPVLYRRLEKNLGGAGGFSFGTRLGMQEGFDWLWLMDDDGVPAATALAEIMAVGSEMGVVNSLVADIQGDNDLAFPLENFPGIQSVQQAQAAGPVIQGSASPFNGTLVSAKVFGKIGYPSRGFFIWGDEVDFLQRAKRAGFAVGTATHALHRHPKNKKSQKSLLGVANVQYVADNGRLAIFIRNYVYIMRQYEGVLNCVKFIAKQFALELISVRDVARSWIVLKSAFTGLFYFPETVRVQRTDSFVPDIAKSTDFSPAPAK